MQFKALMQNINENAIAAYEKAVTLVFSVILFFTTLTILIGTIRLFYRIGDLIKLGGITGDYLYIFTDVLTLFIIIELSRSIYEYITIRKLRITLVIDAAIVFVIRDIMIALFKHELSNETMYAISTLVFALGIVRIGFTLSELRSEKQTE